MIPKRNPAGLEIAIANEVNTMLSNSGFIFFLILYFIILFIYLFKELSTPYFYITKLLIISLKNKK